MRKLFVTLCGFLCLSGCSPDIEHYAKEKPTFDIRQYLNGHLEAWGGFFSRSGEADPRFYVQLQGSWKGDDGVLSENFVYSDGKKQQRVWHLHFTDAHHFVGNAADVIGTAQGAQYGDAVHMRYVLRIERDGSSHDVDMDDWLYLVDQDHVINRTQMSKFGVKIGELAIGFRKID
jgi:hypothetical protein